MARRGRWLAREPLAFAFALLLHGALVVVVKRWAVPRPLVLETTTPGQVKAPDEIDLDVSLPRGEEAPSTEAPTAALEAPPSGTRRVPMARSLATPPGEPPPEPPVASLEPDAPPSASAAAAGSPSGPIDLGIGPDSWQGWLAHMPRATPVAPTPRGRPLVSAPPVSSTGGLQEGLEKHDQKLGLGPAGRVASALYQAAHSPDAPEVGTALFNVTVLRSGAVEVSLGDSTDKRWQAVATRAAEELRRAPPRIPPPREGYRLTLAITALETMPNGLTRKDLHGPRLGATPLRFRDLKEAQKELSLKNPTAGVDPNAEIRGSPIAVDLPGVYVEGQGKVCGYRFGVTPLGLILQGGCDPANAGAKFQRLVRTEVREQSAF